MKSLTRQFHSRPVLARVFRVATEIRNAKQITGFDLARKLGVSHKTIMRDVDLLKRLGAPIWFNVRRHTWIWDPRLRVPWYFGGDIQDPKIL